jgi:hypothetical protein
MIAKVRRRAISSLRLLINPFQLFPGVRLASSGERTLAPTQAVDMMAAGLFANVFPCEPGSLPAFAGKIRQGAIPVAAVK